VEQRIAVNSSEGFATQRDEHGEVLIRCEEFNRSKWLTTCNTYATQWHPRTEDANGNIQAIEQPGACVTYCEHHENGSFIEHNRSACIEATLRNEDTQLHKFTIA
jgi:hypothetical protein